MQGTRWRPEKPPAREWHISTGGTMTKATSKKARKAARKAFPKQPHSTRPFSAKDYEALPNEPNRKPTI
jgi:hypothetical protein